MKTPEVFRVELLPELVKQLDELAASVGATNRHAVLAEAVRLGLAVIDRNPNAYKGPRAASGTGKVDVRNVRRRVFERIEELTERPGQEIPLAQVRAQLSDVPRTEVDDAIRVLRHRGFITLGSLIREPNDLERAAAIMNVAGKALTHAIIVDKGIKKKSVAAEPPNKSAPAPPVPSSVPTAVPASPPPTGPAAPASASPAPSAGPAEPSGSPPREDVGGGAPASN